MFVVVGLRRASSFQGNNNGQCPLRKNMSFTNDKNMTWILKLINVDSTYYVSTWPKKRVCFHLF